MHHDVFQDFQVERLRIHFDDHGVNAVCRRPHFGPEILRRFQPRLGARLDRPAHRIGLPGKIAKLHEFAGNADDRHLAVFDHEVVLGAFEQIARELQRLLPHHL